jgi:hypothetical protein
MTDGVIAKPAPFSTEWMGKSMYATHREEIRLANRLTDQLMNHEMICEWHTDPFSAVDLFVYEFNYKTLTKGNLICKIDVEAKKERFSKTGPEGIPVSWVRGVCVPKRKYDKIENFDRDLWVGIDNHKFRPRIVCVPYWVPREVGVFDDQSWRYPRSNPIKWQFYAVRSQHYDKLIWTARGIVKWCIDLKNKEVS